MIFLRAHFACSPDLPPLNFFSGWNSCLEMVVAIGKYTFAWISHIHFGNEGKKCILHHITCIHKSLILNCHSTQCYWPPTLEWGCPVSPHIPIHCHTKSLFSYPIYIINRVYTSINSLSQNFCAYIYTQVLYDEDNMQIEIALFNKVVKELLVRSALQKLKRLVLISGC